MMNSHALERGHLEIAEDLRPLYAFGHVEMQVRNIQDSGDFFLKIGLREVILEETFTILEVRGGTHLILSPSDQGIAADTGAPFDLMVDDVAAVHKLMQSLDLSPTQIEDNGIHRYFYVMEPGGHKITVNSSHATEFPV
jgi:hypothetical protein